MKRLWVLFCVMSCFEMSCFAQISDADDKIYDNAVRLYKDKKQSGKEKAFETIVHLDEKGYPWAAKWLAVYYWYDDYERGKTYDTRFENLKKKYIGYYRPLADKGDVSAQYMMYRLTDEAEAEMWLSKAAKKGHLRAQYKMYFVCEENRDEQGSMMWLTKSAQGGYGPALAVRGWLNIYEKKWDEARILMSKAVQAGYDDDACIDMRNVLCNLTPKDWITVIDFLKKNKNYTLSFRIRGIKEGDMEEDKYAINSRVAMLDGIIYIVCEKTGKVGLLKLSKSGKVLGISMPFQYDFIDIVTGPNMWKPFERARYWGDPLWLNVSFLDRLSYQVFTLDGKEADEDLDGNLINK